MNMNKELAGVALNSEKMNSLEIAEVTGKRHADVMRDIRGLLSKGVAECNFALGCYFDSNKQKRPMYDLTKKGCLILASGYDAILREKIINRWEELEKEKQTGGFAVPPTFAEALRLAAKQAELVEKQQAKIAEDKPKVLFADTYKTCKDTILIGELARILKAKKYPIGQNRLFEWMRNNGYLIKKGDCYNQPTQKAMEMGLFEIKKRIIQQGDSKSIISTTTKVTAKGQIYFVNKLLNK